MNTFQHLYKPLLMPKIKEMVQNKRAKILILVTLLFLAIYVTKADVPYITYLSSKNASYCIANHDSRTSAIAWIYPENYAVSSVSKFYPSLESSYNTNFQAEPSQEWVLKNWYLSDWGSIDVILDTRWEDIGIVTSNSEFKHTSETTYHIQQFPVSFSVLGSGSVEILLSEGWNPKEFPSYYIVLGGHDGIRVLFGRIEKFDSNAQYDDLQETFKSDNDIISAESWKSFHLKYDRDSGTLELQSVIDEKQINIVKIQISKKLDPIYFLTRSPGGDARWKIEHRRFIYTNSTGETNLGPTLKTPSEEICVSLYISLCKFCAMDFYLNNDEGIVYLQRGIAGDQNMKEKQWKEVRLVKTDNLQDSVQIYVNTSFTDQLYDNQTGFWAIDEIRVCTEDEIKISRMESKDFDLSVDSVTCQSLKHPRWRPKKEKLPRRPKGNSLQITKVTSTSITFKRAPTVLTNVYTYNYKAVGAKQCNVRYKDAAREKSNGFLIVSGNDVVFNNLIPYTYYEIKVTDAIYNTSQNHRILTSEAASPTEAELPKSLNITTTSSFMKILWEPLNCTLKRGQIFYQINILEGRELVKEYFQDENKVDVQGLKSYTNYTVEVITARNKADLEERTNNTVKRVYYARTAPGVAGKVKNLEVYSVDVEGASWRYDLPAQPNGVPVSVRYRACTFGYECHPIVEKIKRCELWKEKFCIQVGSLLSSKAYHASVSLLNENTTKFGDLVKVAFFTRNRVPAPPTNLNYSMVNCDAGGHMCHINITWEHPYFQNSSIRFFEVMLTKQFLPDEYESIKEVYTVVKYLPVYWKIVRYIPFSTTYNISVRSTNLASSEYASIVITTDHLGQHINQSPKLMEITQTSVSYYIPILDPRLSSYLLVAIVQDNDHKLSPTDDLSALAEGDLCRDYGDSWIATVTEVTDHANYNITIGDSSASNSSLLNNTVTNKPLSTGDDYCITFVITNRHMDKEHVVVYHEDSVKVAEDGRIDFVTTSRTSTYVVIVSAIITIVGLLIGLWGGLRFWRQRRIRKNVGNSDPIYMSLESLTNAGSNQTYDKLITD